VTDPDAILKDPSIDCVVEVMGGTSLAKTVVMEALAQKKAVVTANKTLLAAHLDEIVKAAGATPMAMEAAVCGGIPIIHALQSCYAGDTIQSVSGIMNGTTNYMLCKMEEGADYGDVLKEAQDLGFAEADPTADVEGHDVSRSTC
jgi:homoserine dehydrogenase